MPGPISPVRRVLADKNKNATLQNNKYEKAGSTVQIISLEPSKSRKETSLEPSGDNRPLGPQIGQKRKIDHVDDAEREEDSQRSTDTQPLSDLSEIEGAEQTMDSSNDTTSTAQTSLPSFHASQAEVGPVEIQFEIHEEMSQKTLDKLHAVSLPQNHSMSFLRPSLLKDNSQISVSMSSLIDFDQNGSQPETGSDWAEKEKANPQKADHDTRKGLVSEKAATLRTRLQLAFYKVQTNQASTPFSRLTQPSKPASPQPQPYSSSPMSSPHVPTRSKYINSPESRVAIARARATTQRKPAVKQLADIPMPDIRPAAFSARWQSTHPTEAPPPPPPPPQQQQQIPSSPPDSQGTTASLRLSALPPMRVQTPSPPAAAGKRAQQLPQPHTPMQLSSPPGSPSYCPRGPDTAARKVQKREEKESRYGGLTSSVVKGEAANSLLQLTRAGANGNGSENENENETGNVLMEDV